MAELRVSADPITPPAPAAVIAPEPRTHPPGGGNVVRQHIRGSSLLLAGRFITIGINFVVQVLTVRYLTKADYGAFAYAVGVATLGTSTVLMGLGKAIARLVPMYHEQRNYRRAFGHIVLAAATMWGIGIAIIVLLHVFQAPIARLAAMQPRELTLLLILIALAPLEAFDNMLQQVVALFVNARAIFIRRQILGPGFRLAAVLLVVLTGGSVYMLAYGYVVGPILGVGLYIALLVRVWRKAGLLEHLRPGRFSLPARELFGFSVPLLSSELAVVLRGSAAVILLEYFHSTWQVANYRAVLSVAGLNTLVFDAFGFLFVPLASRMFARREYSGISHLYWETSLWIAVLTFPVFLVTCSLAKPLTVWLFGPRYASAGMVLAILSVGYYVNAALGFNAATLRVHGKLRTIVVNDIAAALFCVVISIVLIRRYGAVGAALSTTCTIVVQNISNNVALWATHTGVEFLEWRFVRVYCLLALTSIGVFLTQWLLAPPVYVSFAMAAVVSIAIVRLTRHALRPEVTFPELLRVPVLRWLLT